jgi:hypothetical protein
VATSTAHFVAEETANQAPHSVEGMEKSPTRSGHDLMDISLFDQGQMEISPAHSGHDLMDIGQMEIGISQLNQGQMEIGLPQFDQGQLGVASPFDHDQLGVASQASHGQMRIDMPQFHHGHREITAPLHPALKQAKTFREYIRTSAARVSRPPPTTFAWFLQQMNISDLGFSEYHKNILREYVKDFTRYEQMMGARVGRIE